MEIRLEEVPVMTIEEFADKYDLTMVVKERRNPSAPSSRYYAMFDGCEVTDRCMLSPLYGNGPSQDQAISAYAEEISLKTIAFNAMESNRMEIVAPRLESKES